MKAYNIRLSDEVLDIIRVIFSEYFLENDRLWLFGSRVDVKKRGGDIDLYIETYMDNYEIIAKKKISFLSKLKQKIGDQKIDLVLRVMSSDHILPIYKIARSEGVQLI